MTRLALAVFASALAFASPAEVDPLALGRECTKSFYAGDAASLWPRFSPEMKRLLGNVDGLRAFAKRVSAEAGSETRVLDESISSPGGLAVYTRTAEFSKSPAPVIVRFAFDREGTIAGFLVRPEARAAPSEFGDYRTKTRLRLPFLGEWRVFWGGRTVAENYHAVAGDQRYSYDFVVIRNGSTHAGDGKANNDYFAYGQPIHSPADGRVAASIDGVSENRPGEMNPAQPPGNYVVLDHGNGEYSLLAHLQPGTVRVHAGDAVKAGDPVGLCGNSGNSSEPHLHYHLQNAAAFGKGAGLPAQFESYLADGKPVSRGEPRRGETVSAQPR